MVFTKNYTNSKDYSSMTPAIRRKGALLSPLDPYLLHFSVITAAAPPGHLLTLYTYLPFTPNLTTHATCSPLTQAYLASPLYMLPMRCTVIGHPGGHL